MKHALTIAILVSFLSLNHNVNAQIRSSFSGEQETFSSELVSFMGPNLNEEQTALLESLVTAWDSTLIHTSSRPLIIKTAMNLENKRMRSNPHFIDFIATIMTFVDYDIDHAMLNIWLEGLNKLASESETRVSEVTSFIKSASNLIREKILYSSNSLTWKTTANKFTFRNDTAFMISIPLSDIICYAQRDSTVIYNTQGSYSPVSGKWSGKGGMITWAKAAYPENEVYARAEAYALDLGKSSFEIDSILFTNTAYFDEPVYGKLSDRAININKPENASYPKFETYQKTFVLDNIYENIDFTGGLAFEGALVIGKGEPYTPAVIKIYRNDTLVVKAASNSFIFNRENIQTQSTAFTLYLGNDSIYHSDIAFSYNVPGKELNTFKSRFPTSESPYFNSYHKMDMYFDYLSWKMDQSLITLSRARGASIGQAYFESSSYFSENEFLNLMGIDDYHPLFRLKSFSEWYYNETFPVSELARWLNQPVEVVMALCIDLANKGFLFFDRVNNEVTIKQKLYDYINAFGKKQDYDVISIFSETRKPLDNATLDLQNYKMNIEGIPRIFLSDSQNVRIYPYDRSIMLEKNRSFEFDGVVQAGMISVFGNDFKFSYDTFKIKLARVDSIMLSIETGEFNEEGRALARKVEDLIQMTQAELLIDDPENKSGQASLKQYPIFYAYSDSYVFYDRIPGLEGIYPRSDYFFRLEPFTFENTDRLRPSDLELQGTFHGGKIIDTLNQTLTLQHDNSLGFSYNIPPEGMDVYGGKGKIYKLIEMSNQGMKGNGSLDYLTAHLESDEFNFFPDSVLASAKNMTITANTIFPDVKAGATDIKWYPDNDEFYSQPADNSSFSMFDNGTSLDGELLLKSNGLSGEGEISLKDSYLRGSDYSFSPSAIYTDSASYYLKSLSGQGFAFVADDAGVSIDFETNRSTFSLNSDSSMVKFPEVNYISTMSDFEYNMQERVLLMSQENKADRELMKADELLRQNLNDLEKPTFFSTHMLNDTIRFSARSGKYLLEEEKIIVDNINYIPVADALIQPGNGTLSIGKGAKTDPIQNALIAINNRHLIHDANVNIIRSNRYSANGLYDYVDESGSVQTISFDEITVDSLRSEGKGHIPAHDNFMLSPWFTFQGDVSFTGDKDKLYFLGSTGIVHDCDRLGSLPLKFESEINPDNVMIPVSNKPRGMNGSLIAAGSYITIDSTHIYSALLSPGKSWSDSPLVQAMGYIIYDKEERRYKIGQREKLANPNLPGNIITFNPVTCEVYSEGQVKPGLDYGLMSLNSAGRISHKTDSDIVRLDLIIAFDFHFSEPALNIMAEEIRLIPTLKPVDISGNAYNLAMQNLMGEDAAARLKEEMNLYGMSRTLPKDFQPELVLNDLKLVWNQEAQSYRSIGRIGLGFVGKQAMNVYVDGYVELQKRRSGDILDIYLKVDNTTWYWFSYTRGVMMSLSGNPAFNTILTEEKTGDRRHPEHSVRTPYTYMVGIQERLDYFLRKMEGEKQDAGVTDDPIKYR
ncbi:MAG: hypothetical protein RQ743_07495 [Bacteroidales bacterium]|nr:hypothetical protein [Bacteroidales bacterium]